jgi:hypothetical protein
MSGAVATRDDHQTFCTVERWILVSNARGKAVRHHQTYELTLHDGRILRTRISRPVDRTTYGKAMFHHILSDQLQATEAEYWLCVEDRKPPDRGGPVGRSDPRSLPASLVYQLIHEVRVPESEVAAMTRDEAINRMQEYWSRPSE